MDTPSPEIDSDEVDDSPTEANDLDELHDESTLAYTYYNFIPEDLYSDVKSGAVDLSQISGEALEAIIEKGDFTDEQADYLMQTHETAVTNKFDDFASN